MTSQHPSMKIAKQTSIFTYKNRSRYIIPSKTNHNHQRDQHGYQRNQEKKNHQEHVWQKILGGQKNLEISRNQSDSVTKSINLIFHL